MNNTRAIRFAGTVALLAATTSCVTKEKEPAKKMNILYIMTDDHSYQTISAYDKRYIHTPNLDRIANEGVRFCNSYVGNSISGPSRAIMLTGKFSHKNGFRKNSDHFDGGQQTFPKLLQQAGYQTAMVGKWHLNSLPTGFDYWNILPGQGEYYNPDFNEMGEKKRIEGYATNITTDIAIDWLENKRDKDKPFCLLLHHKAPHRTWMPDTCDFDLFKDNEFPLPETFYDNYEGRPAANQQKMSILEDMNVVYDLKMTDKDGGIKTSRPDLEEAGWSKVQRMNPQQRQAWFAHYDPVIKDFKEKKRTGKDLYYWKFQRYMRDYLRCITSVDRNVGRVLQYLEDNGLLENTLVVYTSDQGFYMGEHGWFDKRFMYEESFRTPLMMRLPGGKKHGDIDQFVQNIDYAPTFLQLAGVEVPADMQGQSLLPLLEGENPRDWRQSLYYHYYEFPDEHAVKRHYGARSPRYKVIHFYDDIDEWEFYDLQADPQEMNNLIHDPAYASQIDSMKQELVRLQDLYEDRDTTTYY